jgi:hypothetical protein
MNLFIRFFARSSFLIYAVVAVSNVAIAQKAPSVSPTPSPSVSPSPSPSVSPGSEKVTQQKICSFDAVESLLPPTPSSEQSNSPISYLAQQGFTQSSDGSWVCYVNDPKKEGRYYTLLKVQELNGKLIASSFLDSGSLIEGQENRSLDFFMTLIGNHTKTSQGNRQSIRRYLESFISLVRLGKIQPSRRGYLFDEPSRSFIIYHPLGSGEIKGTGITININSPYRLGSTQAR